MKDGSFLCYRRSALSLADKLHVNSALVTVIAESHMWTARYVGANKHGLNDAVTGLEVRVETVHLADLREFGHQAVVCRFGYLRECLSS